MASPVPGWYDDLVKLARIAVLFSCASLTLPGQIEGLRDSAQIGPPVGSRAAGFTLPDQSGQSRALASLMGPKGLVLVFFRSAGW